MTAKRRAIRSSSRAKDGRILEEGITEAGALCSFTAAGTSYATHGEEMIPFAIFYSMFGYQRVGDFIWAAADARAKGFLMGATAGRTTLSGEGLQHADGHSPLLFSGVPTCRAYDPAWAYELAVILRDGLRRMYEEDEACFYYITLYNEPYPHPAMPPGVEEGIVRGLYRFKGSELPSETAPRVQLLGSGPILREAARAQRILEERFAVAADVWSATSYLMLRREAMEIDRWNLLHPQEEPRVPYLLSQLGGARGPIIAASDYLRAVPHQVAPWLPGRLTALGTDGFGRSDSRPALRRHFEVDAEFIAYTALRRLADAGMFPPQNLGKALGDLGIDAGKVDPTKV